MARDRSVSIYVKSHTGFRLVPSSVILYDLKRHISPYFALLQPNSIALEAYYVTVVEYRFTISAEYYLPLLAKTDSRSSRTFSLR